MSTLRAILRAFVVFLILPWVLLRLVLYLVLCKVLPGDAARLRTRSARAFARSLEKLGGTFVKLGQILAMRADFIPVEFIEELSFLLDRVRPFPTTAAVAIVEEELGAKVSEIFAEFPGEPAASASFGQVYRARLRGGDEVAVKVLRPGIETSVRADLAILGGLAWVIDVSTILLTVSARTFFRELRTYTEQELDYAIEARNVGQLYENAVGSEIERIPNVYWDLSTSRVLVMEFLRGVWMTEILEALRTRDEERLESWQADGMDLTLVARRLLYVLLRQVFLHGVFHADPHAANIVVLPGNVIGLVDFGIIGHLGGDYQRNMFQLFRGIGSGSPAAAFAAIVGILSPGAHVDLRSFKRSYEDNVQSWLESVTDRRAPTRQKSAGALVVSQLLLVRQYGLRLPAAVTRFYRSLMIVDSLILRLWPAVDTPAEIQHSIRQIVIDRLAARLGPDRLVPALLGYGAVLLELPSVVTATFDSPLLREALDGVRALETGAQRVGRAVGRVVAYFLRVLALALVAAALAKWLGGRPELALAWLRASAQALAFGAAGAWFASRLLRSQIY
jgi:ubiquinone biosynthesis protein